MSTPVRDLALIGAGYWGKNLARNFNALGVLHTICDQTPSTLANYETGYADVRKTTQLGEVLADLTITKVAIAAPAVLHYQIVKAALQAGKDVLVEKPLCLDTRQGEELVAQAEQLRRVLMVGHLLQYHPCILKLQQLLAAGELGKLHYITSNRLNLGKIRREENAWWSFAPHDISVILSLAGHQLPQRIGATGESYLTKNVADTTLTALAFADGVRAHVYVSWLNPFKEQKLTVVGSHAMAVFDDTRPWTEKLMVFRHYLNWANGQVPTPTKARGEAVLVPESEPLRDECQHFLDCCAERRPPRTDGHEGLRVLRVLQAAQVSLDREGEKVDPATLFSSPTTAYFAHPSAVVDDGAIIGRDTKIWHFSHVMKGARLGERCVLGQNVNIDGGTVIGNNVKIQNNISIYTGLVIEDDVFLGPSCVLTNVTNPRSQVNRHRLYQKTVIRRGATIGANATIVCGVTIGRYAFIGAGAVVTRDVPDYALMLGNPARQHGWMSRHGHRLTKADTDGIMTCPESGYRYALRASAVTPDATSPQPLRCLDLDEESPLPEALTRGERSYADFKQAAAASTEAGGSLA